MRRYLIPIALLTTLALMTGLTAARDHGASLDSQIVQTLDGLKITTNGVYSPAASTLASVLAEGADANGVAITGITSLTGKTGGGAIAFVSTGTLVTGPLNASSVLVNGVAVGSSDLTSLSVTTGNATDTITYTVPGGTLAATGDYLEFEAWGFDATPAFSITYGGTTLWGAFSPANACMIQGRIVRTGASSQVSLIMGISDDAQRVVVDTSAARDNSVNQALTVTSSGGTIYGLLVRKVSAP